MPAYFDVVFQELNNIVSIKFDEKQTSFDTKMDQVTEVSKFVADHRVLSNRDAVDQHPIRAITNLQSSLDKKIEQIDSISNIYIENLVK